MKSTLNQKKLSSKISAGSFSQWLKEFSEVQPTEKGSNVPCGDCRIFAGTGIKIENDKPRIAEQIRRRHFELGIKQECELLIRVRLGGGGNGPAQSKVSFSDDL